MSARLSSTLPTPNNHPATRAAAGQGFDPPRTPRVSYSLKDRRVAVKPSAPTRPASARGQAPRARADVSASHTATTPIDFGIPGPSTSTLPPSTPRTPRSPATPRKARTQATTPTTPRQGGGKPHHITLGAGRALWTKKSTGPATPRQRGGLGGGAVAGGSCPLGFTIQSFTQVTSPPADRSGLSFLDYSNDLDTHEALFSSPHIHRALAAAREARKPRIYFQYCAHCRDHTPHLERAWEVLAAVVQACPNLDYAGALPPHLPTPQSLPDGNQEVNRCGLEHFLYPEAHKYRPVSDCSEIYLVCQPWGGAMKTLKVSDPEAAVSALQQLLPELLEANLRVCDLRVSGLPKRLLRAAPSPYLKLRVGECQQSTSPQPQTHAPDFQGAALAFRVDQPGRQTLEVEVWNEKGGGKKGKKGSFMGRAVLDLATLQCGAGEVREVPLQDNGLGGSRGAVGQARLGVLTCSLLALGEPFDGAESLSAQSPSPSTTSPPQESSTESQGGLVGRWGESVSSLPDFEMDVLDASIPPCLPDFSATIG